MAGHRWSVDSSQVKINAMGSGIQGNSMGAAFRFPSLSKNASICFLGHLKACVESLASGNRLEGI